MKTVYVISNVEILRSIHLYHRKVNDGPQMDQKQQLYMQSVNEHSDVHERLWENLSSESFEPNGMVVPMLKVEIFSGNAIRIHSVKLYGHWTFICICVCFAHININATMYGMCYWQ